MVKQRRDRRGLEKIFVQIPSTDKGSEAGAKILKYLDEHFADVFTIE